MFFQDPRPVGPSAEALLRARDDLKAQIALLEDEWRSGMERDTLVLLDHAYGHLEQVEAELSQLGSTARAGT